MGGKVPKGSPGLLEAEDQVTLPGYLQLLAIRLETSDAVSALGGSREGGRGW